MLVCVPQSPNDQHQQLYYNLHTTHSMRIHQTRDDPPDLSNLHDFHIPISQYDTMPSRYLFQHTRLDILFYPFDDAHRAGRHAYQRTGQVDQLGEGDGVCEGGVIECSGRIGGRVL